MAKVTIELDEGLAQNFQAVSGRPIEEAVLDALAMYNWAIGESLNGSHILSAFPGKSNAKQLKMPVLEEARTDYYRRRTLAF